MFVQYNDNLFFGLYNWAYYMPLKLKSIYYQLIDRDERVILGLCALMLLLAIGCSSANELFTKYPGNNYTSWQWLLLAPLIVVMFGIAKVARDMAPRLAYFTRYYTLYYLIVTSMSLFLNGIQYTPFPTIDQTLGHWDLVLGINTPALLAWTAEHSWIKSLFIVSYNTTTTELFFLPMVLAILLLRRQLNEYLLSISISIIIGGMIYYFWPTAAPVSIFHSVNFLADQQATALKFYQIHHYIQPTTTQGGMIAFPSLHVVYAIVCTYVVRNKWWLFIPLAIINFITIVSTVMLGWHYLIDALGGIVLAIVSLLLVKFFITKVYK